MQRRAFLSLGLSLPLLSLGCAVITQPVSGSRSKSAFFVPGYDVTAAIRQGVVPDSVRQHDEQTMITRLDPLSGAIKRAIIPVRGHQICPHPTAGYALFACQSSRDMALIDTETLDVITIKPIENPGYVGSGHALFIQQGAQLITAERALSKPYTRKPENHFGRIVIRDPKTLQELAAFSSHGILPHEIQLINNGKELVIAHYGTTKADYNASNPYHIEPSIVIIELASGKLLHKIVPETKYFEIRHLVADDRTVTAITNRLEKGLKTDNDPEYHLPAPIYQWRPGTGLNATADKTGKPFMVHRAQSVINSPSQRCIIVSVTEANQLVFINTEDGTVKNVLHTTEFGIQKPRGLALLGNDHTHFAVAGSRQYLAVINLTNYQVKQVYQEVFFEHSHMTYI